MLETLYQESLKRKKEPNVGSYTSSMRQLICSTIWRSLSSRLASVWKR